MCVAMHGSHDTKKLRILHVANNNFCMVTKGEGLLHARVSSILYNAILHGPVVRRTHSDMSFSSFLNLAVDWRI